jgi:hypothetical protein
VLLFANRPPWKFQSYIYSCMISSGFPSIKLLMIFCHCFKLSKLTLKKFSLLNRSIMSLLYGLISSELICLWVLSTIDAKNSVMNSIITSCVLSFFLSFFLSYCRSSILLENTIYRDLLVFSRSVFPIRFCKMLHRICLSVIIT